MTITVKKSKLVLLLSSIALSSSIAYASNDNADDRYVYLGADIGISEPVVKKFIHKESDTHFRLKRSSMFGGRVGYSFYPNMMIELSGTYQPQYRLTYILPATKIEQLGMTIPKTPGGTKVSSQVFTANLVYEFAKQFADIKPYVMFGAGLAKIDIKETTTSTNAFEKLGLESMGLGSDVKFFKIKKNSINCFTWQAGAGISKDITDNLMVDIGAKLQVVNNIKIKYDTLDIVKGGFVPQKPVKKTIGVGEFTLGFTFKIPV